MGMTSTQRSIEDMEAEYAAMEDKRTSEARALRDQIQSARGPQKMSGDGVLPDLSILETQERSAVYWLGVIPGDHKTWTNMPPQHQIDGIGGGVGFYEYWTPHEGEGQDGQARRGQYPGHLVELTESQVSEIRKGLRSTVVRWHNRDGRQPWGYLVRIPRRDDIEEVKQRLGLNDREVARLKVKAEMFQLLPTDEPVARYIYCQKVTGPEAKPGGKWRPSTTIPPSVEQVGHIEGP